MIYVARNPKDALVSFYYFHHMVKFFQFTGTLEQFAEYFIQSKRKLLEKSRKFKKNKKKNTNIDAPVSSHVDSVLLIGTRCLGE